MNRIKELRRKFPMSQAELAKALHVSQASISGYEKGNYEPDFELTKQMADLFGVSIDYLLGRDAEPQTQPVTRTSSSGLTDEDLAKIAELVQPNAEAPRTLEARIVSFGMDKLPKEDRERLLAMIRALYSNRPELFNNDKKGDTDDARY